MINLDTFFVGLTLTAYCHELRESSDVCTIQSQAEVLRDHSHPHWECGSSWASLCLEADKLESSLKHTTPPRKSSCLDYLVASPTDYHPTWVWQDSSGIQEIQVLAKNTIGQTWFKNYHDCQPLVNTYLVKGKKIKFKFYRTVIFWHEYEKNIIWLLTNFLNA